MRGGRIALLAAYGAMILACSVPALAWDRLGPFEYRSHFEPNPGASPQSGSRDGWESYPLAEDAGYDPTINPETEGGRSSIVREMAPTQDGDFQLGFIRRMHMVTVEGSSFSVRLCYPSANGDTPIVVSVFRGVREERIRGVLHGRGWEEIRLPVQGSAELVSALAVTADVTGAVRGRVERLLMTDVRLKGLGVRRIEMDAPDSLWDATREFYYVRRAFYPGEDLVARMRSQGRGDAAWELLSPEGARVAQGKGYGVRYHFAMTDAPGLWTLHLSDPEATTTAMLLVRRRDSGGLLFAKAPTISDELLLIVRKRQEQLRAITHVETGMNIEQMDSHWLLAGLSSYFAIVSNSAELAMLDAVDFRTTGSRKSLEESQSLLEGIAKWPEWTHPWFPAHGYHSYYPVGLMTKDVVVAEQFLGDACPPELGRRLAASLMERSVKPVYEEYVLEDRLQFNTSNWIGNTVGGALLAALQSEDPDAAGYAIGLYVKDRDHISSTYTKDGSYGEGVSYEKFDLGMTSLVAEVARRVLGDSLDERLAGSEIYMQYASYGGEGFLDYGDSHGEVAPSNVFAYMASHNRSDSLSDFYFRHLGAGDTELVSRILWESKIDRRETHSAPPVDTSRLFAARGIVVLRDGWGPAATVVTMRAGANYNHNHADQGSIFFAHGGTLWLGEAGYADYYKDPSYPTYNIQAIGHNTLLVDDDEASQSLPGNSVFGVAPRFERCLIGAAASLVQADLTSVYRGKLKAYTRTLFFREGGPLVVIDQVRSDASHRFTQVWHPKTSINEFDEGAHVFQLADGAGHAKVDVQSFSTAPIHSRKGVSPMPLALYERAEREMVDRPLEVRVSTATPQKQASIVTLVRPLDESNHRRSDVEWKQMADGFLIKTSEWAVRVEDHPVSRASGTLGQGSILASWTDGALLLNGYEYESVGGGEAITFDHPVDMQFKRDQRGHLALEIDASEVTEVALRGLSLVGDARTSHGSRQIQALHLSAGRTSVALQETRATIPLRGTSSLIGPK